jgi:hypothetical protein
MPFIGGYILFNNVLVVIFNTFSITKALFGRIIVKTLIVMETLNKNWLTEGLLDFEYKKYILLAYLQNVKKHFDKAELYPPLSDLIWHYKNLLSFKETSHMLESGFKKELRDIDLNNQKMIYADYVNEEWIKEINNIINYATPLLQQNINSGRDIYELIEKHLNLETVGLMPVNNSEGYFLFHYTKSKKVPAYYYSVSKIHTTEGTGRAIYTSYMGTYSVGINSSYESIKDQLIKANKHLPVPAVYSIQTELLVPFKETLMPIAKRYFLRKSNL